MINDQTAGQTQTSWEDDQFCALIALGLERTSRDAAMLRNGSKDKGIAPCGIPAKNGSFSTAIRSLLKRGRR